MQRALDFALPRQRVNEPMQPDGGLDVGEFLALVVEQLQVGDEAEGIRHRDHSRQQADPIPGDARGALFAFVTPQRLARAGVAFVAEGQNAGAEVGEVQLRRPAGLPQ